MYILKLIGGSLFSRYNFIESAIRQTAVNEKRKILALRYELRTKIKAQNISQLKSFQILGFRKSISIFSVVSKGSVFFFLKIMFLFSFYAVIGF